MSQIVPIVNELALYKPEASKQVMANFENAPKQFQKSAETTLVSALNQLKANDIAGAQKTYSTFSTAVEGSMGNNPELKALADAAKVQAELLKLPQEDGVNIAKASALQLLASINPATANSIVGAEKERAATEGQLLDNRIKQYEADNGISLKDIAKNKEERFKVEASERTHVESQPFVRKYIDSRTAFEIMKTADSTASGDEALLTQFVKMGDPGSVVSVTEKGGVKNVTIGDYIGSLQAKLTSEGSLGEVKRKELKNQAFKMLNASKKQYEEYKDNSLPGYAERGLNPKNIFVLPSSEQLREDAKKVEMSPEEQRARNMLRPAAGFGNTMTPSTMQQQSRAVGNPSDVDSILKQFGVK
jgi:hypothetical protein